MTTRIRLDGDRLVIDDETGMVSGRHYSQLVYWGSVRSPVPDFSSLAQ